MEIEHLLLKEINPPKDEIPLYQGWIAKFLEGHIALPESRVVNHPYFVQERGYLYLKKTYKQETKILQELKRIIESTVCPVDAPRLPLNEAQQLAVEMACRNPLTVLTGGPGTGKTYTAGYIIRTLRDRSFILAAPTGKACAQLKLSILSSCQGMELPPFRVMTLHALLERHKEVSLPVIPEELVIVDESSMVDIDLFGELLSKVRVQARLVLLGDPNQLPPVETPSIFPDVVDLCSKLGLHANLHTCLRVESSELIHYGEALLRGEIAFPLGELSDFKIDGSMEAILTPLKKGPFGVDALNRGLFEKMLDSEEEELKVPVIVTKNDFSLKLFNGETGFIRFKKSQWSGELRSTKGAIGLFFVEGVEKEFAAYELPPFDLSFALSVHKSQGSAYDHPVLLLPPGIAHFGRELVYTAFTRAKKGLTVYGDRNALFELLQKSSRRQFALLERYDTF